MLIFYLWVVVFLWRVSFILLNFGEFVLGRLNLRIYIFSRWAKIVYASLFDVPGLKFMKSCDMDYSSGTNAFRSGMLGSVLLENVNWETWPKDQSGCMVKFYEARDPRGNELNWKNLKHCITIVYRRYLQICPHA